MKDRLAREAIDAIIEFWRLPPLFRCLIRARLEVQADPQAEMLREAARAGQLAAALREIRNEEAA